MAILQLHRIQHSICISLVFLIQFSSLQFLTHGYTVPDKYFINCGSDSNVSESGKNYVGESNLKTSFRNSTTERSESSVPSPLYETARIFQSDSWYEFNIDTNGTYLVRLHFLAFSSTTNLSSAMFNVSVSGFWLLQNFNETNNNNNSALVKEFYMHITSPRLKITFRPLPSSFAFVNAIELFILPLHLISNTVAGFSVNSGSLGTYNGLYSRVLETKHRLNVGGQATNDTLLRKWIPDDSYILNPENAENRSPYRAQINVTDVSDDSNGPNANRFTAPSDVYGTAKEINNSSASAKNLTWALPVDNNTNHLIRLHFCDYWNSQAGLIYFNLFIYDKYVMPIDTNDEAVKQEVPAPFYYDFVVHSDSAGHMKVGLVPNATAPIPNVFLNGIEIMKLIETSSSIPPDPVSSSNNHSTLPVMLGSVVLGGLVLVFVVVIL